MAIVERGLSIEKNSIEGDVRRDLRARIPVNSVGRKMTLRGRVACLMIKC